MKKTYVWFIVYTKAIQIRSLVRCLLSSIPRGTSPLFILSCPLWLEEQLPIGAPFRPWKTAKYSWGILCMGGCGENLLHPYCTLGRPSPDTFLSVTPPSYAARFGIVWMTYSHRGSLLRRIRLFDSAGSICRSWFYCEPLAGGIVIVPYRDRKDLNPSWQYGRMV